MCSDKLINPKNNFQDQLNLSHVSLGVYPL